jgi:hypothetical protein
LPHNLRRASGKGKDNGEGVQNTTFHEGSAFSLTDIVPARYDAAAYRIDALSY